jgi:CheY-like chemotaxis protein
MKWRASVPVLYDVPTVILSLLAAIAASAVALFVVSRNRLTVVSVVVGSIVMGSGIAAMHYTGMAAMRVAAMCHYDGEHVPRGALTVLRVAQESGTPFPLVLTDAQMPEADGFTLAEAIKKDPAISGATVVMLTSAGQPGDAARCRELGVAGYLTKPIKRAELRVAIQVALGGLSAGRDRLITRHSLREERRTGRILVVDDNVVNQIVASRLLEKRGHTVGVSIVPVSPPTLSLP